MQMILIINKCLYKKTNFSSNEIGATCFAQTSHVSIVASNETSHIHTRTQLPVDTMTKNWAHLCPKYQGTFYGVE